MKNQLFLLILCFSLYSCATTRKPIPPGEIPPAKTTSAADEQYGNKVLNALTDQFKLDYNNPRAVEVQDIVDRLAKAAHADKDPWHVYIFKEDKVKNAAATRGNHVFIWTGLLNFTKSEAELSAIIGHEMSHVLAGHTDPDPSEEIRKLLIGIGSMAAGLAVSIAVKSPQVGDTLGRITANATNQIGQGILVNPYSKDLEYEADQIGLFLMSDAGFNPQSAIDFWQRAEHDPDFSSTVAFLATHPPATERLKKLENMLPQAQIRYQAAKNGTPISSSQGKGQLLPESEDTFAIAGKSQPRIKEAVDFLNEPQQNATSTNDWKVKSEKTFLYERPSVDSKKIGELSKGAIVKVIRNRNGWLEIVEPDSGFLITSELAAE